LLCWRKLKIDEGESLMALYELRTYTLYVGKMAEATKLYQELGFPALNKGGHDKKLLVLAAARMRGFPAENERTAVHSEIVGSRSGVSFPGE
jgi:hypothetical protein